MSNLPTANGLYSFPGLAKLADNEGVKLSYETNRAFLFHILSKIGVTVGQKIAQKRKYDAILFQ